MNLPDCPSSFQALEKWTQGRGPAVPFGVRPGAAWRRASAPETGLEQRSARSLELSRRAHSERRRGRRWNEHDRLVALELEARCATLGDLQAWRNVEAAVWFAGLVPRTLRPLVRALWEAYRRDRFGVLVSRCELAALLDCCPRTITNWLRQAVDLGLIAGEDLDDGRRVPVRGWRESTTQTDGSEQDRNLLRIGPTLELLAGLASFASTDVERRLDCAIADPGDEAVREVRVTRAGARARERLLCRASQLFARAQLGAHWAGQELERGRETEQSTSREASTPSTFGRYLEAALEGRATVREPATTPTEHPRPRMTAPAVTIQVATPVARATSQTAHVEARVGAVSPDSAVSRVRAARGKNFPTIPPPSTGGGVDSGEPGAGPRAPRGSVLAPLAARTRETAESGETAPTRASTPATGQQTRDEVTSTTMPRHRRQPAPADREPPRQGREPLTERERRAIARIGDEALALEALRFLDAAKRNRKT